jgi:hypothetical protein
MKQNDTSVTQDPTPIDDSCDFLDAAVLVEDRAFGSIYPVVQWINGKPTAKKEGGIAHTGGLFYSTEQGIELPGFEPYTLVTRDGTEVEGFAARDIELVIIRTRRSWLLRSADAKALPQRFAVEEYDEDIAGARGQAHLLCTINGTKDPVMLSVSGHVSKAFMSVGNGKVRGILPRFATKVVGAASRLTAKRGKKAMPLCSFKLHIGPARDEVGKPVFTEVGAKEKSLVTLPVWLDEPKTVDEAFLKVAYVGHERFSAHQEIHQGSDDWVKAWSAEELVKSRRQPKDKGHDNGDATVEGKGGLPAPNDMGF